MWLKISVALVFVLYTFSSVHGQTSLRDEISTNLTRMVQFVVHPSAKASTEIIDYAMRMGGRPKTLSERISYLNYIKDIARGVPEYMSQFTKTTTNADGTVSQQIDENAFDNAITNKAMEYSDRNKEQPQSQSSPSSTGTGNSVQNGGNTGSQPVAASAPVSVPASVPVQATPAPEPVNPTFKPAADGTVSLLDLFRVVNFNNRLNNLQNVRNR